MEHSCRYYPTVMSGPVIRFGFGFKGPREREMFSGEPVQQWSAEINASRDGVSLQGHFPIYRDRANLDHIKQLLDWAWNAHAAIGSRGDHAAAKEWVRVYNASLAELQEIAAEKATG